MIESDHQDVIQTRQNLQEIGIDTGDEKNPYIDKPLDNAIRIFQKELGLKEDGLMKPQGETEQALNLVLAIKEKTPPLPKNKPKTFNTPPLPQHKEDIYAKIEGQDKAKKMGELGGELFTGRLGRLPINNKILKQILKQTVGRGQDLMETGIEKLLEDYFVGVELEKRKEKRENKQKN